VPLPDGLGSGGEIALVRDVVAVELAACLVPAHIDGDALVDARPNHVADGGASEILKQDVVDSALLTCQVVHFDMNEPA
jgi:hypothetical protein